MKMATPTSLCNKKKLDELTERLFGYPLSSNIIQQPTTWSPPSRSKKLVGPVLHGQFQHLSPRFKPK
ncbi:unnamed protein product [Rotaria magnacalcarata]|uniref:Uncharacterized protein n=1 Tax=Rotaria magnacalcarata TaxID=392030 RepID=A0A816GL01_9BILA|nr:unnamed protein product [Rotaria magnacalcarata]